MIRTVNIDGKEMTVVVLGDPDTVEINDYRKTLLNMFEMASLWESFSMCINPGEIWTALKIIQAFGLPEEQKGGQK